MKKPLLKLALGVAALTAGLTSFGQTYTFTNASATGQNGPTQTQVNAAYAATNLNGNVTVTGSGIQEWTVPATAVYSIEAFGAEGGDSGGLGARMSGEFSLTAGQVLKIIVGQMGETGDNQHGSGGGGSFVVLAADTSALVVAGGGGGHGKGTPGFSAECHGDTLSSGQTPPGSNSTGGTNGGGGAAASGANGGTATTPGSDATGNTWASGGAGFLTNGGGANGGNSAGGRSFVNGGVGGDVPTSGALRAGGFGGGGGAGDRGAGGGGYSGGAGGTSNNDGGGGGGSFNSGSNQSNSYGNNSGHGSVIITNVCAALTQPSISAFSPSTICVTSGPIAVPSATPSGGTYSGTGVTGTTFDPSVAGNGPHYVHYTITDPNTCVLVDSTMITVDLCTDINENNSSEKVSIYPNPTQDFVNINLNTLEGTINYTLTNVEGKIVRQENDVKTKNISIDMRNESNGVYLLKVENNNSTETYKFIKE